MERYDLVYLPSITKDLRGIPKADVRRILAKIEKLRTNPFPAGAVKLADEEIRYRIRQGDYRILYAVDNLVIVVTVVKIGHRRDVYRN